MKPMIANIYVYNYPVYNIDLLSIEFEIDVSFSLETFWCLKEVTHGTLVTQLLSQELYIVNRLREFSCVKINYSRSHPLPSQVFRFTLASSFLANSLRASTIEQKCEKIEGYKQSSAIKTYSNDHLPHHCSFYYFARASIHDRRSA